MHVTLEVTNHPLQRTWRRQIISKKATWDSRSQRSVLIVDLIYRTNCYPGMQTKKKRPSRRVAEESEVPVNGDDAMQVDEKPIVPRQRNLDTNFVDDDELQAALARSRRAKLQKTKKLSPEEIARRSESFFCCCMISYQAHVLYV